MPIIADIGAQDAEVVMLNSITNIGVDIKDNSGVAVNPEALSVELCNLNGSVVLTDIYTPSVDRDPDPPRVINPVAGRYEFPLGLDNDSTVSTDKNKTTIRCDLLLTWKAKRIASTSATQTINPGTGANSILDWTAVSAGSPGNFISIEYVDPAAADQTLSIIRTGAKIVVNLATNGSSTITTIANDIITALAATAAAESALIVSTALSGISDGTDLVGAIAKTLLTNGSDGSEEETLCENVRIITTRICSLIGKLRLQIDKSVKLLAQSGDPDEGCYLGYSDGQLVQYVNDGIQIINAYQPSGAFTLDNYPYAHYEFTLIESALMAGVMSQQLFAIDTDVPSWSDQGNAFVIQHQPQLASYLSWLSQRLDKLIPQLKLNFVSSGSLHIEAGPNFRLAQLIDAAPAGALFRNVYFKGG